MFVADNGSTDGTLDLVSHFDVTVVRNHDNLGYAAGNNRGVDAALAAGCDPVMVLNNDTVVTPEAIERLVAVLHARPELGAVSPVMRTGEAIWFSGSRELSSGVVIQTTTGATGVVEVPALIGVCIVARRAVWTDVGGFDERYFLIWEDIEWSRRARRGGWVLGVVAASTIHHDVGHSFASTAPGLGAFYYLRNGLLYFWDDDRRWIRIPRFLYRHGVRPMAVALLHDRRSVRILVRSNAAALVSIATRRFGRAPAWAAIEGK